MPILLYRLSTVSCAGCLMACITAGLSHRSVSDGLHHSRYFPKSDFVASCTLLDFHLLPVWSIYRVLLLREESQLVG